ncbi:MAG: DNA primase [Clostridia bacterium]|nr:DNA primase [Clostridia bacterium]
MPNLTQAVDEIKNRANIVDVVGSVVELKRTGANHKGCCPFHKEKTPSFIVTEDRGTYHCFGCGEHGDAIKFIEKYYNLTFPEAVTRLAAQYGITIEDTNTYDDHKRDAYYNANKLAARFFFDRLSKEANKGYSYMAGRGMDAKTMQGFGIGWAPDDWSQLTDYLKSQGVSMQILEDLGLAGRKGDRYYDKFRGRVMFPILNTSGKVIAFGGRIVGPGEPKYLNSPETPVFQKKNNLYGLHKTRKAIQEAGYAILVEGYMDCVSLYQYGVCNVVASLGTALTEQQARLLKRYTEKVILCYDADNAGIKAALRGIDVLRAAEMQVRVLHVDDGKDPDEYVKKHGKDAFIKLVEEKAVPDIEYKINLIEKKYNRSDATQGVKFLKEVAAVLKPLSPVEADIYIQNVSVGYHISEGALRREIEGTKEPQNAAPRQLEEGTEQKLETADLNLEKMILRLIMLHSEYYEKLKDYPECFVTNEGYALKTFFENRYKPGIDLDLNSIKDGLEEPEYNYLKSIQNTVAPGDDEAAFKDCLSKLNEKRRQKRLNEITDILSMADSLPEEQVDQNQMKALLMEYKELQKKKE